MHATPGGQLPTDEIVGRDGFIAHLWRILERNSLRLEAERRIGKTHILLKMQAEAPDGWVPVFLDLEHVHSAAEFAGRICKVVLQNLDGWQREGQRLKQIVNLVRPSGQIGPLKFEVDIPKGNLWKNALIGAIEDLVEHQQAVGKRVVFLFDEMPWMISAIADPKRDGPQVAMEVLDVLRGLRQSPATRAGFRMVLCGSVGMHHVLGALRRLGHGNQPVNDMMLVEVPPLDPLIAVQLAIDLMTGEGLTHDASAPSATSDQTGGFPYYIHWVVDHLKIQGRQATLDSVNRAIEELLTATHDPCNFRHFRHRLDGYYPGETREALAILDHAAASLDPLPLDELMNVARIAGAKDDERIRNLITLLSLDHYLTRETNGHYVFRHVLLRRWWVLERGLKPAGGAR